MRAPVVRRMNMEPVTDMADASRSMSPGGPPDPAAAAAAAAVQAVQVANHRAFLAYVERRVGDRAIAEEIVQDAFVRSLDRGEGARDSLVGWFYRVLHNAVVDHLRRRAMVNRRLEQFAAELAAAPPEPAAEAAAVVCGCVSQLATALKPEYADALRSIEVEGTAVKDYAAARGISASNAGVRIFRAREALRREVARACGTCATHGCQDCSCRAAQPAR